MPLHAVLVEVVQDGDTSLVCASLPKLPVIGLGSAGASIMRPAPAPALGGVGGGDTGCGTRPEPPVDKRRLQVGTVAAFEVTFPAGGPDVLDVPLEDVLLDELFLVLGLDAHEVLTVLPAGGD